MLACNFTTCHNSLDLTIIRDDISIFTAMSDLSIKLSSRDHDNVTRDT